MSVPRETLFLVLSVFIANMLTFAASIAFAWTSPCIPRLNGDKEPHNNPLKRNITSTEESLLVSLYFVGALFGPFLSGIVGAKFGRKISIIVFTIPVTISFVMIAFASHIGVFYAARFISGLSGGTMYSVVPIYVAELSESHNRGILGAILGMMSMFGNLFSYSVGSYTSIMWFSIISLIVPATLFLIFPLFIPETPYYWIANGDENKAMEVLKKIRSKNEKDLLEEIEQIKYNIDISRKEAKGVNAIWKTRAGRKSLLITTLGAAVQQLSGIFAIQLYLQSIFQRAGSDLSPENSTIIIGAVKVLSYAITVAAVDRLGRRFLLIESSFGACLSLAGLGTFFYLQDAGHDVTAVNWLPITCLIIFAIAYNSGMGIVPTIYVGEFFPDNLKSAAAAVVVTSSSVLSFAITLSYPYMVEAIDIGPSFWVFAGTSLFCAIYGFLVPETKGKSPSEIQELLTN